MTSSARRALNVLQIVNDSPEAIGVTAIAEAAGILAGTAFRSLDALERGEFVARYRASTQYQVGPTVHRLRHTLYAQFPLWTLAVPFLRRLRYASGETVSLTVPVGWFALRLAIIPGPSPVRSGKTVGIAGVLDNDFAGQTILAGFDANKLARFCADAPAADGVVRDDEQLKRLLASISNPGYALDTSHSAHGHCGIALPVRHSGKVIACLAIEGPVVDLEQGPEQEQLAGWLAIVGELEHHLGESEGVNGPFAHLDPELLTRMLRHSSRKPGGTPAGPGPAYRDVDEG